MKSCLFKKYRIGMALMALVAFNAGAAVVDQADAQAVAVSFLNSQRTGKIASAAGGPMQLVHAERSLANKDACDYYVFDAGSGDAFVIVAGDDRAEAVLAYGEGALDLTDVPCNLQWMLDSYKEQMEYLLAHPDIQPEKAPQKASYRVSPLLPSNWSQGTPYNLQCPWGFPTGCVATAMAQVMYYWRHPAELPGVSSYTTNSLGITLPELPGTVVDWDNMLDDYWLAGYSYASANAVATLMRYCGQACQMDYFSTGSSAAVDRQLQAMRSFSYNQTSMHLIKDDYPVEDWESIMLTDLMFNEPILYTGYDESAGHAFVVDGYDGSKFHINWGWAGTGNGYFALDAFYVQGYSFNNNQEMIVNVYPQGLSPTSAKPHDFEVDGIGYKVKGDEAEVTFMNYTGNSYADDVVIPSQVTYGGKTYPVTAIGHSAFRKCSRLKSLTLPNTIKSIGKYAFRDCYLLRSITIPSSVTVIDNAAFIGCYLLSNVTLNNGLKSIEYFAFFDTPSLTAVNVPSTVTNVGDGAFMYSGVTRVTLGNSVSNLNDYTFYACSYLADVTIGDKVKNIGDYVFEGCTFLTNVTIGSSVEWIGNEAFVDCPSLMSLVLKPVDPPVVMGTESFDEDVYQKVTLYVLPDSWIDYVCADIWTLFENIEEIAASAPGDVNGDNEINVADVNALIDVIINGIESEYGRADVNHDGEVNIADVNALIDMILRG